MVALRKRRMENLPTGEVPSVAPVAFPERSGLAGRRTTLRRAAEGHHFHRMGTGQGRVRSGSSARLYGRPSSIIAVRFARNSVSVRFCLLAARWSAAIRPRGSRTGTGTFLSSRAIGGGPRLPTGLVAFIAIHGFPRKHLFRAKALGQFRASQALNIV